MMIIIHKHLYTVLFVYYTAGVFSAQRRYFYFLLRMFITPS